MARFDLSDGTVPILTTKRIFWKTAVKEMLWFLTNNPSSRRMLFHGWNVAELGQMALPPCHMVYQYHVTSDGRLNSLCFQRSADLLLGVPFFSGVAVPASVTMH